MTGFFRYHWTATGLPQSGAKYGFLFKASGVLDFDNLAEALNQAINTLLYPDAIIVQCMKSEFSDVCAACDHVAVLQSMRRMSTRTAFAIAGYDVAGLLQVFKAVPGVGHAADLEAILKTQHEAIVQAGLEQLFDVPHVQLAAPSGFTFVKPSGERSVLFLKAEEALSDTEQVQFVAFALLPRLARRDELFKTPMTTIYIDSMAISSVAYALRDLYRMKKGIPVPRVVSFHSHEGLKNLDRPMLHTSFCLISASSSMRLQRLWKTYTESTADEVVTLITLSSAEGCDEALHKLPKRSVDMPPKIKEDLRDIRIMGERFHPEQISPKSVLLREKYHQVTSVTQMVKQLEAAPIFRVQVRTPREPSKVRPFFVDTSVLMETECFNKWVERIAHQFVPASLQRIIVQNDDASRELANRLIRIIREKFGVNVGSQLLSSDDLLKEPVPIERDRALLIVAAVIGKGTRLLSISRDLRDIHSGSRLYVIGLQITETQAQIKTLGENLKFSASKANIVIERFNALAVGGGVERSFIQEADEIGNIMEECALPFAQDRLAKNQGSEVGMTEDTFWPSLNGLAHLLLRKDFAYWKDVAYNAGSGHAPWVLATVSTILQRAREETSIESEYQLATDAFQHVVLNPENFARYNDGVIQAALLRAAYPSELDYACSSELSHTMKELLVKIFIQRHHHQGEAAFEFAVALRIGKLKIKNDDLVDMHERIRSTLKSTDDSDKLLFEILNQPNAPINKSTSL